MNPVHILRDDAGFQQLRPGDGMSVPAPAVNGLAPYSTVRDDSGHQSGQRRSPEHERRHADRRGLERRRVEAVVMLDTRCQHERRTRHRRAGDNQRHSLSGINLYI